LLITEYCRGYNDDYVSQHARNKVQMFADSTDATVPYTTQSVAHAHECYERFRCL